MQEEGQGQLVCDGTPGAARRLVLSVLFRSVGRLLPLSHVTRVLRMEAEGHHGTKQATVASGFKSAPSPPSSGGGGRPRSSVPGPLRGPRGRSSDEPIAPGAGSTCCASGPRPPPTRWGDSRACGSAGLCSWGLKAACHQGPAECALCPRRPAPN